MTDPEMILGEEFEHPDRRPNGSTRGKRLIARVEDVPPLSACGGGDIEFTVAGCIPAGAVTAFTGAAGAGKSTVLLSMCGRIACGRDWAGFATQKRPVLVLDREMPLAIVRERFERLHLPELPEFRVWGIWLPEMPPTPGANIIMEWVQRTQPKPVIVVDPLISFFPSGKSENDSTAMRGVMHQLRLLASMGATVAVNHHTGKGESSVDYRGSSDFAASIDAGFVVESASGGIERLTLRAFKSRVQVEPEIRLSYADGIFTRDEYNHGPSKTVTEQLLELLKENPRVGKTEFEALAAARGLGRNRARSFLESGAKRGTISVEVGDRGRGFYTWQGERGHETTT
jgi:hypothetical protein